MENNSRTRMSNVELLRIIAMLMIVGHHMAVHGVCQVTAGDAAYSIYGTGSQFNKAVVSLFAPGGEIGVAIFFMITGYFQINKNIFSVKKIILQSFFYGWFCTLAAIVVQLAEGSLSLYTLKHIAKFAVNAVFTPITGNVWWFVTSYILIMLLSPFINRFLNMLNKKGYIVVILLMWIFWYYEAYSNGAVYYSIQRGIIYYVIGAYCRTNSRVLSGMAEKMVYLLASILMWSISAVLFYNIFQYNIAAKATPEMAVLSARYSQINTVLVVPLCTYMIFKFFVSVKMAHHYVINRLAQATLGVYLIHDSELGRECIWNMMANADKYFQTKMFPVMAVVIVMAVYGICTVIDLLRIRYIEPHALKAFDKIERFFSRNFCRM